MRRIAYIFLLSSAAGCTTFTRAQMDLVDQARRGVTIVAQADQDRDRDVADLAKLRRQRLDAAFDDDVRTRSTQEALDADWVIDARKAYAAGLDAYAKTQAASERNSDVRKRNLAAIDAALDRLHWMQSVQMKFNLLPDEVQREHD
jgi:hypothetical protein